MENSVDAEVLPFVPKNNTEAATQDATPESPEPAILPTEDHTERIEEVTKLLQGTDVIGPGQEIIATGRTDNVSQIKRPEQRRILREAGLNPPWYIKLLTPVKFIRSLFSKNKPKIVDARQQTTTKEYQVVNRRDQSTDARPPLQNAA